MKKKNYMVTDEKRFFSGCEHVVVENDRGDRFFLDPAFLFILEHIEDEALPEKARMVGVGEEDLPYVIKMLAGAGLISE